MSDTEVTISVTPEETERCGEHLAERLVPGDVILLEGDLAAGKTTFVRGLVRGLGGTPKSVTSPTFVIVQTYPCGSHVRDLHHIDLYRLPDDPGSLREIGIEEIVADENAVVAIEWPRNLLETWLPTIITPIRVGLSIQPDGNRLIEVSLRR